MLEVWGWSLLSVTVVSLISLVGIFTISLNRQKLGEILLILVSFAVGGLFGDAFIHLIPEAFESFGNKLVVSLLVLSGILLFFILEKFIRWRHCHVPTSENHPHPVVFMNLIGDGVHNIMDGMIIAASYLVSFPIGLATTLAVILHEIPQEIGDFGILVHGGLTVRRALLFNFLSAVLAIFGAVISLTIGPLVKDYALYILPITAGGFIYMAGSDLIPSLHDSCELGESWKQFLAIVLGLGIMVGLLYIAH
ncbi:MAG: ZIP family metal transporter [Candidatus Margulisbacteria bacterium]|nr:ZIP family metal transporter [Candidatus Margulisiibacteriota bacterium]MBU1617485.1 ZIP family metal transporter [Candidatus Margulisiibacteriota bacterium]MBU1867516.1 ZIP family metal transporter [Candidatus Margulisiibacteriota bacterium]